MTRKKYMKLMRCLLTRMSAELEKPLDLKVLRSNKIINGKWAITGADAPESYQSFYDSIWMIRERYGM